MQFRLKGDWQPPTHHQDDITRMLRVIGADDTFTQREIVKHAWSKFSIEAHDRLGTPPLWYPMNMLASDAELKDILRRYLEVVEY